MLLLQFLLLSTKASPKEIRHLDEERPTTAMQPRFKLSGERIESAPINIVVVSNIKRRARIRCPTEQELSFSIRLQRIKINSSANENEARELVGRLECHEILVERYEPRVVSSESLLGKVEIEVERRRRLIVDVRVYSEDSARSGIKRRITNGGRRRSVA